MPDPRAAPVLRRRWAPLLLWVAVAALSLLVPERFILGAPPPWAEAGVHVALFAVGTWAVGRAFRLSWPAAIVLGAVLAAGTEGLQGALPIYRSASVGDTLCNLVGVGLGVAVLGWRRSPHDRFVGTEIGEASVAAQNSDA